MRGSERAATAESQPILRWPHSSSMQGSLGKGRAPRAASSSMRRCRALSSSIEVVRKSGPSQSGSAYSIFGFASDLRSRCVERAARKGHDQEAARAISTLWTCWPRSSCAASCCRPMPARGKHDEARRQRLDRARVAAMRAPLRRRCPPSAHRRRAGRSALGRSGAEIFGDGGRRAPGGPHPRRLHARRSRVRPPARATPPTAIAAANGSNAVVKLRAVRRGRHDSTHE